MCDDRVDERVTVADLRDDGASRLLDESRDPLANEHGVLGDDHPER